MQLRRRNAVFLSIVILALIVAGMSFFLLNRARAEAVSQISPVPSPTPPIEIVGGDNQAYHSEGSAGNPAIHPPVQVAQVQETPSPTPTSETTPQPTPQPTPSPADVAPLQTPDFEPAPEDKITTCADIWDVNEIPFDIPEIINFPPSIDSLATDLNYYFLAAMLIQNDAIDTSTCPFNGLLTATTANQCGVDIAKPVILEWQNQYDAKIFETGVKYGVPSRLLKKVFALESQFWPGVYLDITESGLGQLNETGADAVLMYNSRFFGQFCPLVLHQSTCNQGYLGMNSSGRALLRGALVRQVNASCDGCSIGIDTNRALSSIPIFAEVIKANCSQVGQMIYNDTGKNSGTVSDYVNLWKITMANYNAGPGCVDDAISKAWLNGEDITWDAVQKYLTSDQCSGAKFYVTDIFK